MEFIRFSAFQVLPDYKVTVRRRNSRHRPLRPALLTLTGLATVQSQRMAGSGKQHCGDRNTRKRRLWAERDRAVGELCGGFVRTPGLRRK